MEYTQTEDKEITQAPLFTVIVAVFNGEQTLSRCLDSLLKQTLSSLQIICVDDASTDRSLQVLALYASMDHRIRVFHLTENTGPSHARNVALRYALGCYTTFLDCDDWFSVDALEQAYRVFQQHKDTDCVLFHLEEVVKNGTMRMYPLNVQRRTGNKAFIESLTWKVHGCYAVTTAIHKRFPYDETSRTYSDDNTTRLHYLHSRYVDCCEGTYYYWQNPNSVTHRVDISHLNHLLATDSMKRQLIRASQPKSVMAIYEKVRWLVVIDCCYWYYCHKRSLSHFQRLRALAMIRTSWRNIDSSLLPIKYRSKFGYILFRNNWTLFWCQETAYFFIRNMLKRQ